MELNAKPLFVSSVAQETVPMLCTSGDQICPISLLQAACL